jgi:hypothetical protein
MSSWQIQAAKDQTTLPAILNSLFQYPECHDFLVKNPSSPQSLLASLGVKEAFTSDPMNRRMSVAEILREAPTPEIVDRILTWTEGSLNILQDGEDPDSISYSRRINTYFYPSAAQNPNTPVKYLKEFANSKDETTIWYLTQNPSLPMPIIEEFAEKLAKAETDSEIHTYSRVVENIKINKKYLLEFSKHSKHSIRAAVARNPNTPEEAQLRLAEDSDSYVFFQLQFNEELCESALAKMCERTRSDIRNSTQWVDDYYRNLRDRVLSGHYSESLKKLVASPDWPRQG